MIRILLNVTSNSNLIVKNRINNKIIDYINVDYIFLIVY